MIINYFKIAFRHIWKNKFFSVLNILGLTVALTCSFLIINYIRYERSFDRYHENADHTYRIVKRADGKWKNSDLWNAVPSTLKPFIVEHIPEVQMAATICNNSYNAMINHDGKHIREDKFYVAEPEFLQLFSLPVLKGNPETALDEPGSLILSETMAKKYFSNSDPIGKKLNIDDVDYTITGILRDVPKNSHFTINFLASFLDLNATTWDTRNQGGPMMWNSNNFSVYVQLKPEVDPTILGNKIRESIKSVTNIDYSNEIILQKITDIHLHSKVNREFEANGNILYIYIFTGIAIILLLIAGFNYTNLTMVQIFTYDKESGIRKVIGANSKQILYQYLGEAVMLSFVAGIISVFISILLIPLFKNFTERDLTVNLFLAPDSLLFYFAIVIMIGILSGGYPAIVLANKNIVNSLKNLRTKGMQSLGIRNSLIVFQFTISIILIICTVVFFKQMDYIQSKELGYNKENIINIPLDDEDRMKHFTVFKNELLKYPGITDVTFSNETFESVNWGGNPRYPGQEEGEHLHFYHLIGDHNLLEFYNIKLLEGNTFSKDMKVKGRRSYMLLNKKAVEALQWDDAVGRQLALQMWSVDSKVIGVVDDFNYQSLHLDIAPLAISLGDPERHSYNISVKVTSGNLSAALQHCESVFNEIYPGYTFTYSFIDDLLSSNYETDQKLGKLFGAFSIIAIFVALLGLFGLASFIIKKRTKEIGVRMVNGARGSEIISMLTQDFSKWVIIAFVLATPTAYYAMQMWLENFAFKTSISWWVFAVSGLSALGIALLTVSWQSWRAASRNPVEALRYE